MHFRLVEQILFLNSLTLVVGTRKTLYSPTQKLKIRGTSCFLGGALLVYFAWPLFVTIVRMFTFLDLLGHAARPIALILGTTANFGVCSEAIPFVLVLFQWLSSVGRFLTLPYARAVAIASTAYFSI
jgi:hypothetical protein